MTNDSQFMPPEWDVAISLLSLGVVVAIMAWAIHRAARVRPVDVDWLAGGPAASAVQPIYAAYLRRHWRLRTLGCLAGLTVAVVAGLNWPGDTLLSFGIGGGPMGSDLLVGALAGITLGTLAAESYRLRARRSPQPQARLEARPSRPQPKLTWTARAITTAAIGLASLATVLWHTPAAWAGALLAVAVTALAEVTQVAIIDRQRLTNNLVDAVDLRLRAFAGRSVAWLELSGAVLGFGWCVSALDPANDVVGVTMGTTIAICLVVAVVALLRSSGRAPRGWQPLVAA